METLLILAALAAAIVGIFLLYEENRRLGRALDRSLRKRDMMLQDIRALATIVQESTDERVRKAARFLTGVYGNGEE